ncbi:MAG: cadherin-like beta sandwich domain-containing protein [Oscillospiraceae bacterium]|nr:cadherin-like beta sandwich domain-containing protein [Oscillospiraceae bacterium]
MKKIIAIALTLVLSICLLSLTVSAASASATMTGPGTVRAGDTITVTFNLSGSGVEGITGTLSYDKSLLTLSSTSQKIASPWVVEFNGNSFMAYDNDMSKPINSNTAIFSATFKVSSSASTGTKLKVSCTGVTASDGNKDTVLGEISYSKEVSRPLSTDNKLKSLSVSNATISPNFSANTTSYTASVPYSVSKLDITAKANDSNAKVSISNPTLTADDTTKVSVTVTAENGSKKTYTISVYRAKDPNYVANDDNNLKELTVEDFYLSPLFTPDNTQYVIWLPYETEAVTVTGTPNDSKASIRVEGGEELLPGQDNEIKVVCTAENGTEKTYLVIAKRAAAHDAEPTEPITEPTEPETTEPSTEATEPETQPAPTQPEKDAGLDLDTGKLVILGALILLAGLVLGFIIGRIFRP